MRIRRLLFLAALVLGCDPGVYNPNGGGQGGSGGAGGTSGMMTQTPQEYFTTNVAPVLSNNCAACHMGANATGPGGAPTFLGTSMSTFYDKIKSDTRMYTPTDPASSLLITKGTHEGPGLTASQADTVKTWLMREANP